MPIKPAFSWHTAHTLVAPLCILEDDDGNDDDCEEGYKNFYCNGTSLYVFKQANEDETLF